MAQTTPTPIVAVANSGRHRSRFGRLIASPVSVTAAILVLIVVLLAVFGPVLWSAQASAFDTANVNSGPTARHWFGTDDLGRDIGLRVLVATRMAVGLAIIATAIGLLGGLALGGLTALAGRRVGRAVTELVNLAVAFPGLLLAVFFAIIFGVGKTGAVLALGVAAAPWFARLTQTLIASVLERDYVQAARSMGVGRLALLRRHVLPNIGEPLLINTAIGAGNHLLAFAGLSFLGIGVQPPDYDWGRLLLEGVDNIYTNPVGALGPGLAIVIAGLAFNLTGETAASTLSTQQQTVPRRPPGRTVPGAARMADTLVDTRGLWVRLPVGARWVPAVRGIDLQLAPGETIGVVGESGSGKSLTAMAVAGLLPRNLHADADLLTVAQIDMSAPESAIRKQIADSLPVVFQDPMSSLNPTMRVGSQLAEVAREHQGMGRAEARDKATKVLGRVRIADPRRRATQFPHEFSGGMRQRALSSLALRGRPKLIIADEPTTALDVTVQRHVLDVLDSVQHDTGAAMMLISHDLAVIASRTDRVLVMYAGRVVERIDAASLATAARHPYTRALLRAVPDLHTDRTQPLASIPGKPPTPQDLPPGCPFAPRCGFATEICWQEEPPLTVDPSGAAVACWHPQSCDQRHQEANDDG